MEARYGRKRRASGDRRLAIALGATLLVALLAFIFWAAFGTKPAIVGTVTNFTVANSHSMDLTVSVSNPTGRRVKCQVSATMPNGSSVGSKEIKFTDARTSAQNLTITTIEPANGAIVDVCWTY
jgi:Domain of unknown function (DUF4307)